MLSSLFPFLYGGVALILLWQAFRVMSIGRFADNPPKRGGKKNSLRDEDRTGRITIHPELLDQEGRITNEELLTVRFSEDNEPPHSAETTAE